MGNSWGAGTGRSTASYSPTICTIIARRRGELSKTTKMICCYVPSVNFPSLNGTVSDGPSSAASAAFMKIAILTTFSRKIDSQGHDRIS